MLRATLGFGLLVAVAAGVVWWLGTHPDVPPVPTLDAGAGAATAPDRAGGADAGAAPNAAASDVSARDLVVASAVVRGRLLSAGTPLAGAAVIAYGQRDHRPVEVARAASDADGRFAFAMPERPFELRVDAPVAPREWKLSWLRPRRADLALGDVHVPVAGRITGTVRGESGQLVAGAIVRHAGGEPSSWWPNGDVRAPFATRTDAAGRFVVDRVLPGDSQLQVLADGFAVAVERVALAEPAAAVVVDVVLARGESLHGFVFDWRGQVLPGAVVYCASSAREVVTDGRGRFDLTHHRRGDAVRVRADGHVEEWITDPDAERLAAIRLGRAHTLRGIVRGAGAAGATVRLECDYGALEGNESARPYELMERPLPVAADGTFVLEGLSTCHYVVTATAPGVGASAPLHLALRGDQDIELAIVPQPIVRITVRDAGGAPLTAAELVFDPELNTRDYLTSLYRDGTDELAEQIFGGYARRLQTLRSDDQGRIHLAVPPERAFAFAVRAPGFLPLARLFAAGQLAGEVDVVLQRAGAVRGIVRGGSATAYQRAVVLWRVEDEARMRALGQKGAERFEPRRSGVDAAGQFAVDGLVPGAWRAAVARSGGAHAGAPDHEQIGRLPLVDESADLRGVVEFTVAGGETAAVAIDEPALGTVRGRVLLEGRVCRDASVFASRSGQQFSSLHRGGDTDWDEDLIRGWASGQRVAADGSFRFLYQDAGPVELRVRHANAAATSDPVVLTLPPPGDDVLQDLEVPLGTIRGSCDASSLDERLRKHASVVLFPLRKASEDPFHFTEWRPSVAWSCSKHELAAGEDFVFEFLPDGDYVVRSTLGQASTWQRVVTVRSAPVDLGRLQPDATTAVTLSWTWREGAPASMRVVGAWLYLVPTGDRPLVWAGTWARGDGASVSGQLPVGDYRIVPFGWFEAEGVPGWPDSFGGITGDALADPVAVTVHADGTTTPAVLSFTPKPPPPR